MKPFASFPILIFFIVLAVLQPGRSLAQNAPSKPSPAAESTWQLLALNGFYQGRVPRPFIHFILATHTITGNNGCNNFTGTFNLSGQALSFNNNFTVTRRSCQGLNERAFFSKLFETNRFITKGDTLVLQLNSTPLSYWIRVR